MIPSSSKPSTVGRRVLGIVAKRPRSGQVKTRLAADTSPEWAARVAEAFLLDMLDRLALIDADRVVVFDPPGEARYFQDASRDRFRLVPQKEGDLGSRMAGFIDHELRHGAEQVVLLGSDSPSYPIAFVEQAFDELAKANVVLGPAMDGGYCLIGCSRRLPPIFEGISWGTAAVVSETVARLSDPCWRLALLPPWYDVDTIDDWRMLQGHLAALRRAGIDPGVPRSSMLGETANHLR